MSDGEGEDSFWGDRRDRRRRGGRSTSRSPPNRRSPSPHRSPAASRPEQRRRPSPSRRDSYQRRSPSPPRRSSSFRRGNSPSPSRRQRSPRSAGRYIERAAAPRYADSRYDSRDGPHQRRRSSSPHHSSHPQRPVNDGHVRPRSRSPPPRRQPQHRPMLDPMHSNTMLGSRDFRHALCSAVTRTLPHDSFTRAWFLRAAAGSSEGESAADAAYAAYRKSYAQQSLQAFFRQHCREEWLLNRSSKIILVPSRPAPLHSPAMV